jgi:hypothetical protein
MYTVLHYLNAGLVVAAFAGIVWWMYVQLTKANAQRELEQTSRRAAIQPWGNDKAGGRGNR